MSDRTKRRTKRKLIRRRIWNIKLQAGCMRCPEKHPACLTFHHRDPAKKTFGIRQAISDRTPWETVVTEIEKCDVLCMNCHAKLHYEWLQSSRKAE